MYTFMRTWCNRFVSLLHKEKFLDDDDLDSDERAAYEKYRLALSSMNH